MENRKTKTAGAGGSGGSQISTSSGKSSLLQGEEARQALNDARDRLDLASTLIERALDLLELLDMEIDLDAMRGEVNVFTFACQAYHWDRWSDG